MKNKDKIGGIIGAFFAVCISLWIVLSVGQVNSRNNKPNSKELSRWNMFSIVQSHNQ